MFILLNIVIVAITKSGLVPVAKLVAFGRTIVMPANIGDAFISGSLEETIEAPMEADVFLIFLGLHCEVIGFGNSPCTARSSHLFGGWRGDLMSGTIHDLVFSFYYPYYLLASTTSRRWFVVWGRVSRGLISAG